MLAGIFAGLKALSGFFGFAGGIVHELANAKVQLANAQNEEQRIHAEERVKALEFRANLQATEAKFTRLNAFIRSGIGAAILVLLWKLYVYDKALGQWTGGHTDALSPELWEVIRTVIQFYFLAETVNLGSRAVAMWRRK